MYCTALILVYDLLYYTIVYDSFMICVLPSVIQSQYVSIPYFSTLKRSLFFHSTLSHLHARRELRAGASELPASGEELEEEIEAMRSIYGDEEVQSFGRAGEHFELLVKLPESNGGRWTMAFMPPGVVKKEKLDLGPRGIRAKHRPYAQCSLWLHDTCICHLRHGQRGAFVPGFQRVWSIRTCRRSYVQGQALGKDFDSLA